MADQISSPSVQAASSVVPVAVHKSIVAQLEAKIKVLEADITAAEAKNPIVAAFVFFAIGVVVGLVL